MRLSTLLVIAVVVAAAGGANYAGIAWTEIGQMAVLATLGVLIYQVVLERRARAFEVFRGLIKDYSDILQEESVNPALASIWSPLPETRRSELDAAQARRRIGAYSIMDETERAQYWRTRRVYDIFELAFLARRDLWLTKDIWRRWENLVRVWCGTRYFDYVFADTQEKYSKPFQKYLEACKAQKIEPMAARDGDATSPT